MDAKTLSGLPIAPTHARNTTGFRTWLALGLIVGAALLLRLIGLEADAPTTLSWSGAPFTDEGLYSHAARNRVLFGVWRTDGWDNRLVSPLHDALAYLVFRVFSVGYVQLRLTSVVMATVALVVFWRLIRFDLGDRLALIAAALWGLDYFWLQYSRLGLLEPGMVMWLIVGTWAWRRGLHGSAAWAVMSGIAIGIALVWKSLALLVVPAPLLALLLIGRTWPRLRVATGYVVGLVIVLGVYSIGWYLPNQSELATYNQFYAGERFPASLRELSQALWRNIRSPYVWGQTPVIVAAAVLGFCTVCRRAVCQALPPVVALSLVWAVCGFGLLLMPYSPPRYYTLLLPPLVCLACATVALVDNRSYSKHRYVLGTIVFCLSLLWSGSWYLRWLTERRTTLPDSSRALQALVPPGELVLGVSACGLSLSNTLLCAPPFVGLANDVDPVTMLDAKFALVENNPNDYMRRFYNPLLEDSTAIQTLPFGGQRVTLYRLNRPGSP